MSTNKQPIAFTLGGLAVRLTAAGERWVARVGESVAVGCTARQALTAALQPVGEARIRALLADLALLQPSVEVAEIEAAIRSA